MEHSPVQVTPTLLRAILHQPVNLGVDGLDRQDACQLSQAADPVATGPRLESFAAVTNTNRTDALARFESSGEQQLLGAFTNQGFVAGGAE